MIFLRCEYVLCVVSNEKDQRGGGKSGDGWKPQGRMARSANQACVSARADRAAVGSGAGTAWDALAQAGAPGRMPTRQTSQLIGAPSPPAHGIAAAGTSRPSRMGRAPSSARSRRRSVFTPAPQPGAETLDPHNRLIGRGFFVVRRSFT
jgi:hypothetical protein